MQCRVGRPQVTWKRPLEGVSTTCPEQVGRLESWGVQSREGTGDFCSIACAPGPPVLACPARRSCSSASLAVAWPRGADSGS